MQQTKPLTPAVKGASLTSVLLAIELAGYFWGNPANRGYFYILYAVLFAGILVSASYYARQMNGGVTFGNVFAEGFKTTAVVIVLSAVCIFIGLKFIFPGIVDQLLEIGKQEMRKQGGQSEDQVQKYFEAMRGAMVPIIIGYIIVFFGLSGGLGALVAAIFAKKKPAA